MSAKRALRNGTSLACTVVSGTQPRFFVVKAASMPQILYATDLSIPSERIQILSGDFVRELDFPHKCMR